jgi:ABC-type sugar transport system substrate-binding protein
MGRRRCRTDTGGGGVQQSQRCEQTAQQDGWRQGGYGYKIAVVTHSGAGDAFWSIVKNGAMQAGKDMGDNVTYQSDGDPRGNPH